MLARWKVIDENFISKVKNSDFPKTPDFIKLEEASFYNNSNNINLENIKLNKENFIDLFKIQIYSRHLDIQARILKDKNLSFYTIASSDHEGNAGFSYVFSKDDPALLHYRSAAFVLYRAFKENMLKEELEHQLLSLMASKYDTLCCGRHKLFGSNKLSILPQTSTIASHLPKAVGLALSLEQNKKNKIANNYDNNSVVICSFGDASVNHSTAQGAFNTAKYLKYKNYNLPIIFICEDNQIGISVPTPLKWIQELFIKDKQINYIFTNGLDIEDTVNKANLAYKLAKNERTPVFLHMKTVRLMGHAGSDIEQIYLTDDKISFYESHDPLLHTARIAVEKKYLNSSEIINLYQQIRIEIQSLVDNIIINKKHLTLDSKEDVIKSIIPNKKQDEKVNKIIWGDFLEENNNIKLNLSQAINYVLSETLSKINTSIIFGEDVAKKGGVYRVTKDLEAKYGKSRVFDTLLDEQTILGTAIGFSLNNYLPIPEIQFLAYVHNAIDQIRGEAATLSFFSNSSLSNPMVIRIPSFAYQKGFGGHFHNENSLAPLYDIPGVIIAAPSGPENAVQLFRECIEKAYYENRVCIFLEPIALYFAKDLSLEQDNLWLEYYPDRNNKISLGDISEKIISSENKLNKYNLTLISYANGYYYSSKAAKILHDEYNFNVKLINLNWLNPLPVDKVLNSIINDKNIIIIDECRNTGSILKDLLLNIYKTYNNKNIELLTAEDSFIPLGFSWKYLLPNDNDIINAAIKMARLEESIKI